MGDMHKTEVQTGVWRENMNEEGCLEDPDADGRILRLFQETGFIFC